ncbi:hypothetical protein D3C84_650010 [compost metagenome]
MFVMITRARLASATADVSSPSVKVLCFLTTSHIWKRLSNMELDFVLLLTSSDLLDIGGISDAIAYAAGPPAI